MGYDFMLMRLRSGVGFEPPGIPDDLVEEDVVALTDPAPLLDAVQASDLFVPGSLTGRPSGFRWRTPDGGMLDVDARSTYIAIDTHAHWDFVAQVFDLVRGIWPETVLLDPQKGALHDPRSFREFVVRSYRDKAEWLARQAAGNAPKDVGG